MLKRVSIDGALRVLGYHYIPDDHRNISAPTDYDLSLLLDH